LRGVLRHEVLLGGGHAVLREGQVLGPVPAGLHRAERRRPGVDVQGARGGVPGAGVEHLAGGAARRQGGQVGGGHLLG
ncbi:unnamed protein product, partial [Prorocentrum cordatum]